MVTNISNVIKRMKAISLIENNTAEIKSNPEEVFLNIDELCSPAEKSQSQKHENAYEDNRSDAMKKLIQELIGDRLLELSRYISVNSISKTLIVDKTSLTNDGYQIMMH
jgi:DNA integrity scanning protein DisA with diadenylate cyclase activity